MKRILALVAVLALAVAPGANAQIASGNIYGSVVDESGAVLPGASVTLTGAVGTQTTTSGSQGDFRFLRLQNGDYELAVSLAGFATVTRSVIITTGANVNLTFSMKVATVEETVNVTAETPVVDTKKLGTATTLSNDEMQRVPQARDPWAILRTIPGIIVDRVNIAGNESGSQANFQGKGASSDDITWNLDGIQIDDMAAAGASPSYWDYDAFDEMAVTTGGNDVEVQTGAIGLNFVTKRGTNTWRGSARGFITHDDLQWSNIGGTELEGDPRLGDSDKADHIQQINDYGVEFGGPVLKDKLFVWGSYGKQDIRLLRTNQTADKTILEGFNGKLNWQISDSTQFSAFFFNGKKTKIGRSIGLGILEPEAALWDQSNFYAGDLGDLGVSDMPLGSPHGLLKFELNHIFNPNFFVNVKYANYDTGFTLGSRDLSQTSNVDFVDGVAYGSSFADFGIQRPLKNVVDVDANYFANGWGGQHELKFGFGYRSTPVTTKSTYGGDQGLVAWNFGVPNVHVYRPGLLSWEGTFFSAYLGDTFTKDRLTVSVGVRYDDQKSENLGGTVPGNPNFPNELPALTYGGGGVGIHWQNISPRVGFTYALDEERKTVVRASFAKYASKLDTGATTMDNPVGPAYIAYYWDDRNGDKLPSADEVLIDEGIYYYGGLDPANPTAAISPSTIDPDYKAPTDLEIIAGLDRELMPDLAMSVAYTYRKANDQRNWQPRLGLTTADYTSTGVETANGVSAEGFAPDPALVAAFAGGRILMNRPDYSQGYHGLEFSLIKRLSNKWMGRMAFSYQKHKEYYDGPGAVQSPVRSDTSGGTVSGPQVDGGIFAPRSGGSGKGDGFYAADWQISANALYELPWNMEVAGALYGRQGFARPIIINTANGLDGSIRTMTTATLDDQRYPNLWNFDLRLAKNLSLGGERSLVLSAEMFNVFNSGTELNRFRRADSSAFNRLDEVLSPRVVRFGARLSF